MQAQRGYDIIVKLVKSKQIPARSGVVLRLTDDAELEPIIVSLENGKREDDFVLVDNVLYHFGNKDGNPL